MSTYTNFLQTCRIINSLYLLPIELRNPQKFDLIFLINFGRILRDSAMAWKRQKQTTYFIDRMGSNEEKNIIPAVVKSRDQINHVPAG